jgi:nucleoside-diphosphate-sugar epimerase
VVGDGHQRRDFTYIDDVVDANICAMNAGNTFNIYNVGTGRSYSIVEITDMIKNGEGVEYIGERPAEVRETLADISRTTEDLGWAPVYNLEDKINSY